MSSEASKDERSEVSLLEIMSSEASKDERSEVSLLENDHPSQLTEQSEETLASRTEERAAINFRPDEGRGPAIVEDTLLKEGHQPQEKTLPRKARTVSFSDDVSVSFTDDVYENVHQEKMSGNVQQRNRRSKMEVDDDVDVPYDRGWAWVIDLACFLLMFVYISHDNWHSVLFLDYLKEFDIPVSVVTIMMSIGTVCYCIGTQVSTNVLVARFSIRVVLTSAAIMNVSATLLFSAAPNVGTFFIVNFIKYSTKGVTIIATLVLVGLYFRRRRGLATTLGLLGMSTSFVCVPPLIRFLREEYGFRGCFLILAGFEMHGILAALLLRPINSYRRKKAPQEKTEAALEKVNLLTKENPDDLSKSASKSKSSEHIQMAEVLNNVSIGRCEITEISISETKDRVHDEGIIKTAILADDDNTVSPQKIKNVDFSSGFHPDQKATELSQGINGQLEGINEVASPSVNSVKNTVSKSNQEMVKTKSDTQEYGLTVEHNETDEAAKSAHESDSQKVNDTKEESVETTALVRPDQTSPLSDVYEPSASKIFHASSLSLVFSSTMGSMLNIPHVIEIQTPEPQHEKHPKRNWIRELIDFSLLSNYLAMMIAAMYILVNSCSIFSVVYLPSHAISVGVSPQEASILLTLYGAMDIVGRLGFGILVDLKFLRPHLMIAAACAVLGTITQFMPLFTGFETLILYSVVLGLLGSTGQNLSTVLIVDVVGIERLGKLLPLCSMFNSFAVMIQHPIHGGIIQATGTFIVSFHYLGTCEILASLLLLCEPFIRKLQNNKEKKQVLKRLSGQQP